MEAFNGASEIFSAVRKLVVIRYVIVPVQLFEPDGIGCPGNCGRLRSSTIALSIQSSRPSSTPFHLTIALLAK